METQKQFNCKAHAEFSRLMVVFKDRFSIQLQYNAQAKTWKIKSIVLLKNLSHSHTKQAL